MSRHLDSYDSQNRPLARLAATKNGYLQPFLQPLASRIESFFKNCVAADVSRRILIFARTNVRGYRRKVVQPDITPAGCWRPRSYGSNNTRKNSAGPAVSVLVSV